MSSDEEASSSSSEEVTTEVTTEEFGTMLITFFKPYVEMNNSIEETDCIRRSLEIFSEHLDCKEKVDVYLEVIFSLFECFRCTNSDLIGNALTEYIMRKLKANGIFKELELKPPSLLTPFLVHDVLYFLGTGHQKIVTTDTILFPQAFMFQDTEIVQRLLRYGIPFGIEDVDLDFFFDMSLRCIVDSCYPLASIPPYDEEYVRTKEDEERYFNRISSYTTPESRRRLYFYLMRTMFMILNDEPKNLAVRKFYNNFVNSFKLVFETIPDPLIHIEELGRFLKVILMEENKKGLIREFCRMFEKELAISTMPMQPRSLMHLSRCRVRECLIKTRKLPHGVWSFEIPNEMKNYILVQEREDEYYPKYVSALTEDKPMRNSKRKRTLSSD